MPQYPEPPELDPPASRSFQQKAAGAAFVLAGVLPIFLWALLASRPSQWPSSESALNATLLVIGFSIAFALLMGYMFRRVMWAVSGAENRVRRNVLTTLMLIAAAAAGAVTGVVGGVLIAIAVAGPDQECH